MELSWSSPHHIRVFPSLSRFLSICHGGSGEVDRDVVVPGERRLACLPTCLPVRCLENGNVSLCSVAGLTADRVVPTNQSKVHIFSLPPSSLSSSHSFFVLRTVLASPFRALRGVFMPPTHLPTFPWYRRALVPMFGLGNRKVLKYSAIETSLPIDVEDTVTCFCRSVSGLSRSPTSENGRIRP